LVVLLVAEGAIGCAVGQNLLPTQQIHHGYSCAGNDCPDFGHGSHELGATLSSLEAGGFIAGVPTENMFFGSRSNSVDAGVVFRFDGNGNVVDSIGNPNPISGDRFGAAAAGAGQGFMVIGAPGKDVQIGPTQTAADAGIAYLYTTGGSMVAELNNPSVTANDGFGLTVARMGDDFVMVSKVGDGANPASAGTVYAFTLDPDLHATFNNPFPAAGDLFGISMLSLESTIVVIGAPGDGASLSGAIHIFEPEGNYLDSVANPSAFANALFGYSLAPVGNDRVAIGAPGAETVYIYSQFGNPISSIANPVPTGVSNFGSALIALSDNRLLIGATATGFSHGRVFLYDTDGCRLLDIEHPDGGFHPFFGRALAPCGADGFAIGNPGDDTHESDAGAIYLYQDVEAITHTPIGETAEIFIVNVGGSCADTFGCFEPTSSVVEAFGVVEWCNDSTISHQIVSGTATGGPSGYFDSGTILPGQTFKKFFDDRIGGEVPYYCSTHSAKAGVLHIQNDDNPADATLVSDEVSLSLRYDHDGDEDWVQFCALPSFDVVLKTINVGDSVDPVLDVYRQLSDGSLAIVTCCVDNTGAGQGLEETVTLNAPVAGLYFGRVTYNGSQGSPLDDTEVTLLMDYQEASSSMLISAYDYATQATPLSAVATVTTLFGDVNKVIPPAGAAVYTLTQGQTYLMSANAATGICPYEPYLALSPQTSNVYNQSYGNPRFITFPNPNATKFYFVSTIRIAGSVRDQWTGQQLEGAAITLESTSGPNTGFVYDRYPLALWNNSPWTSLSDGSFPPGMHVQKANYTLRVTKLHYEPLTVQGAIGSPLLNQLFTLDVSMIPIDVDNDGIADAWENSLAPGTELWALGDADGDKFLDIHEYLADTDPMDPYSLLKLRINRIADQMELIWSASLQRSYSVEKLDCPSCPDWITLTGPAPGSVFQNGWMDTNTGIEFDKNYRVNVTIP
jgi:plastocyanin